MREVLRLLASKSTQEEVQEAGAAAGVHLSIWGLDRPLPGSEVLSQLANQEQAPC